MINTEKLFENKSLDLPRYIPIISDRVKSDFDFSNFKNIIIVYGEFLLSYSREHLSPVYKIKRFKKVLDLENLRIL